MRKWIKRVTACLLGLSVAMSGNVKMFGMAAEAEMNTAVQTKTGAIVLDGNDIKAENVNGLTYKGFGMLSANSTSDLLMDYKAQSKEAYAQLMRYLFGGKYPIFTHVKLEMGNDRNNSTGSESATMRTKGEKANVLRNPGWQLAADAKKINPKLKISILTWRMPKWVETDEDKYIWYKQSILAAYEHYGFMVDYINPNTNESWGGDRDIAYTKKFAKWIAAENKNTIPDRKARELFKKIKLVVSDEANVVSPTVAENLKKDQEFLDAVDVVGYHYKTADDENGGMKWLAEEVDKEVWNSEEQATFSNSAFRPANNLKDPTVEGTGIGGSGSALEMGNTIIKSFAESRRGHVIYQPAIGAFYEGAQYSFKELVSARDPWSGWMHYDAGLLMLAHVSKFAVTGWENEKNSAGIWRGVPSACKGSAIQTSSSNAVNGRNGGENYMTLAAPTKDAFSTVIVNDSEYPMTYTLETKNMKLSKEQRLEVWETRAADDGAFNENYMKCIQEISPDGNGIYSFSVKPYAAVTVTSLDVSDSKEHTQQLPVEGTRTVLDTDATGDVQNIEDGYLYADDFEYKGKTVPVLDSNGEITDQTEDYIASRGGDKGTMARYTHTMNGAFEVYKSGTGNRVLRQQVDSTATGVGSAWNVGDPVTVIGDFRWMNYTASVDVMFERAANKQYAQLGIRQTGSNHKISNSCAYSLKVSDNGEWYLYRCNTKKTANKVTELFSGKIAETQVTPGTWFQLKVRGEGNVIKAYINDTLVASYEDDNPITSGRIALGCGNTYTRFDNLAVTKIKGYAPYYTEYLDNMEIYDLTPQKNGKLEYNDKWTHTCADQGMFVYQRSMSYSAQKGAAVTYHFTGTGLELLGSNEAIANEGKVNEVENTVNVTVDGKTYRTNDRLWKADNMCSAYSVSSLPYGEHTVTIELAKGSLQVDAIAVIGDLYQGEEVSIAPKTGTESGLPEEELSKELEGEIVPDLNAVPETSVIKKGDAYTIGKAVYEVTDVSAGTVAYRKPVNTKLTSEVIPATVKLSVDGKKQTFRVTKVSAKAFTGCSKLRKVIIGKNVTEVGKKAFYKNRNLRTIVLKTSNLKKVGKNAFKGIYKKAVFTCNKKEKKKYRKLLSKKTGFTKAMKL